MARWTRDELGRIGETKEILISTARANGTLRRPVIVWVVRVDDDLYVRSYLGREASWFRGTQLSSDGRMSAPGVEKDVSFLPVDDGSLEDRIDLVYRDKYRNHGARYVEAMVRPEAKDTTLRLVPRQK